MKDRLKNTTLYTIAFLLFIFGNSVNVIHFCCDVCRDHGAEIFTEGLCHEELSGRLVSDSDTPSLNKIGDTARCFGQDGFSLFHLANPNDPCSLDHVFIILDNILPNLRTSFVASSAILLSESFLNGFFSKESTSVPFPFYSRVVPLAGRTLLHKICVLRN